MNYPKYKLFQGDCLEVMREWPDKCVDLMFGSPPYEDARLYGELNFNLKGQDWVDWIFVRVKEMVRVTRGLVAMVVSDKTENYEWTATTALLIADLKRAGFHLRRPPLYVRHGISGSGGRDWLKNMYEPIICVTHDGGPLPYGNPLVMANPPKYGPGGPMTHRDKKGRRVNVGGQHINKHGSNQEAKRLKDGRLLRVGGTIYTPPERANPGNLIDCGSGTNFGIGNENEAPFPPKLARFFVRSFCKPGGIVCDPFTGGGTTGAEAIKSGRNFIGIDARQSQIDLTRRRLKQARVKAGFML